MKKQTNNEVIIVRSLTGSDLGIFTAHRSSAKSKQRAININATAAADLLSPRIIRSNGAHLPCQIIFGKEVIKSNRHFGKVGKNWRLGGNKIDGESFSKIDSLDFALIRSVAKNDGADTVSVLFISKITERLKHARIAQLVEGTLNGSMATYLQGNAGFQELAVLFPEVNGSVHPTLSPEQLSETIKRKPSFPPMPPDIIAQPRTRTIQEKIQSPHILEQMLRVSGDLSAAESRSFFEVVVMLADQLRTVLLASERIIPLKKDHIETWKSVRGKAIGFVDGGLASLSMLGAAPVAARVGAYIVRPGDTTDKREQFIELKRLINELYSSPNGGVYKDSFPDHGALRDAARISIEAAGAVKVLGEVPDIEYLFLHGALVNPISRYTDIMRDGQSYYPFPNFSADALSELLTGFPVPSGRDANFISVYLRQLQILEAAKIPVCGVIEREATTTSFTRAILNSLDDHVIAPVLPTPPGEWKKWVRELIDPDDDAIGRRITDSLLFRCVLEPGEVLLPVEIDRNELRKAPESWKKVIAQYPRPQVSYLQTSEWSSPIRLEVFNPGKTIFTQLAILVYHCSLLLPRYAFPAGLDIVDKFAKIPDWMSKPVNINTAVQALKQAMYKGDEKLFDAIRWTLCGTGREWLLRPGITR